MPCRTDHRLPPGLLACGDVWFKRRTEQPVEPSSCLQVHFAEEWNELHHLQARQGWGWGCRHVLLSVQLFASVAWRLERRLADPCALLDPFAW